VEEEMRKSEERYRTILDEMEEGYFETDLVGNLTFINDAGCRNLGYPREELIGMNNRVYADEENAKKVFQAFNKLYRTGEPCRVFDYEITRKDGTKAIIEMSASFVRNSEGDPIGFRGISRHVTEHKKMEEALRQSEERYRTILENMQEVYYEIDLAGNWTFLNEAFYEHLGYTKEEMIGKKSRQYQDETTARVLYQAYTRLYRTGEPIRAVEAKWICKDGAKRTYEMSASLIRDPEGKPIGFRGISRDITERGRVEEALRQSEERYRTILENIQEAYYEMDLAGNFTFVDDTICRHLRYPREELIGMNYRQYQDETTAEKMYQLYSRVYKTGEPIEVLDAEITRKDGTKGTYEMSVSLIRDSKGKPTGFRGVSRDITERKRAEEALRQSEEKYRTILENIQEAYFEDDLSGNLTFFNDVLCRHLGYSRQELIGMNYRQRVDEKDARKLRQFYSELYRTGEPIKALEAEFVRKDGTKHIGEFSASLIRNSEGIPIGFRAISRDITERKQMEEVLREREERYRTLLETMEEGYYEVDLKGRFTFFNDALREMHGLSKEEMLGMSNRKYMDEETANKVYRIFNQVYKTGQPCKIFEWEIIRKDGRKAVMESPVYLIKNAKGEPVGFRGITRDITERKRAEEALRQSEEKYRTILESIKDGYYEVDLAGNFTFFNDSLCRIFGYPKEELMGMNNRQYADKEVAREVFQAFNRVYTTGEPGREFDWEIVRKDGTKRYIEASVSLRKDASGKPVGFRGIARDITDRKRIEEQLSQAEKLRAVGEMASGVAHDFNNALAAILGNTQLLLYTAQDEELKETLKIIEKVAKDSGQTVRRLQDFTRKPVPQELFKVDINSIIKDSIEITKPKWKDEAQSRGIRIEMVSNLEEIPFTSGNASELREVFSNMIFNAIEAMHGGGKVEIRTSKKRRDVFIQISDTGVGIAEEAKKRIFEPFFTTKPFTNTGLGLSMSYGIVKRFGGEIEVESKVGEGTTFTIILPIGEEGKEETVDSQPIKKGRKARILVIDDEEFVRSVLSRTLAQADHQVTLAEDGRRGVQLFKDGKFDIVLTDLGMPGMSGWEVCRMIKEVSPRTPVGMITGWGDERNRSKTEDYGLDFLISKPFDLDQILNVVAETMESKEE
jgi:PAS domain S-box-containing protein